MAQNLILDPKKKDYILSSTGASQPSDRVEEAAFYALQIPQNNWLYGTPNQGSQLYTLQNSKRTASIEQQVQGYALDAIERQLIQTGRAIAAQMENVEITRTGNSSLLEIIPDERQLSTQLAFMAV